MQIAFLGYMSVILFGIGLVSNPLHAQSGAELFSAKCSRCHYDAGQFSTDAEAMRATLKQASIARHRFTLSDEELELIINYIQSARK